MKKIDKNKKVHIRIGGVGENFGITQLLNYITILSEHYMLKYIIYIKLTLFKKHMQNVVVVA